MNCLGNEISRIAYLGQDISRVSWMGKELFSAEKVVEVSGIPPLKLLKSKGEDLQWFSITGNTVQDGTPTPENPV